MAAGSWLGNGKVVNNSDGTVYCLVQDDGPPEIYQLGPGMQSSSLIDVDVVKAVPPATLDASVLGGPGVALWFKFNDMQTATISGTSPNLSIDISLTATSLKTPMTDDQVVAAAGQTGAIDQFMMTAPGWGEAIPEPQDPNTMGGYP